MFNNDLLHAQIISERCKTLYFKAVLYTTVVPDINFSMFGPANCVIQA